MATTLNTAADGPHAFSDREAVRLWENTQWLIEYVEDAIENCGASWSDWTSGEDVRTTYNDDRDGGGGRPVEVGARGLCILDAAVRGEDWEPMMDAWQRDIAGHIA